MFTVRMLKIVVLGFLFALATFFSCFSYALEDQERHEQTRGTKIYNEGVALLDDGDIARAQKKFAEASRESLPGFESDVLSKYNRAWILAQYAGMSLDDLLEAHATFITVLSDDPSDPDTRKNIEIVNARLRELFEERGETADAADAQLDPNNDLRDRGQVTDEPGGPGDGKEPARPPLPPTGF